jgi:3-(3-hydroxy-phenyl)propionate hydroxylase/anhydrotetracycline monooxygenase/bifunctional hydroxylase/dehydrase
MDFEVIIGGGGPTGLMLACELRLCGVRVAVLERLAEPSGLSKAFGFHVRSVETLAYRGLLERFTDGNEHAALARYVHFAAFPLDLSGISSSHPHALGILQARTEAILEGRAQEVGVEIRRGHGVSDLRQDAEGVTVDVSGPAGLYQLRTAYLVGCDGARSAVRERAGIGFPGTGPTLLTRMGDVSLPNELVDKKGLQVPGRGSIPFGIHRTDTGMFTVSPLGPGYYRLSSTEWGAQPDGDQPTLDELRSSIHRVLGIELPMSDPRWVTRFNDSTRQADRYRAGRVLVAGDAAHVHFPSGGQGLNMGIQDAVNLGWKLAAQVRGWAPAGLLDTYDSERRPVGARILSFTRSQVALLSPGAHTTALREIFSRMLENPDVRHDIVERTAQVDTRYDVGVGDEQNPLLGRWAPDLQLRTAQGSTRVAQLLQKARGVLLILAEGTNLETVASGWADRIDTLSAREEKAPPAAALLIRPDGYVAWASDPDASPTVIEQGLRRALTRWFGGALS